MATLQEMMAQKAALEEQIAEAKAHGRKESVTQVKELMAEYGLTVDDLYGKSPRTGSAKGQGQSKLAGAKLAAKYRNVSTGESWSGRGLQPRWLKSALAGGKKLIDFAV